MLGAPSTLWVISRPHNWHPNSTQEWLLHLEIDSGKELGRVQVGRTWIPHPVKEWAECPAWAAGARLLCLAWNTPLFKVSAQPLQPARPPARPPARQPACLQISSKFTHDAVRRRDKVYVCNTGEGKVLELALPGMTQVRQWADAAQWMRGCAVVDGRWGQGKAGH